MHKRWEFRVNGIRSSADTFASYGDAFERMFRSLNTLHFECEGEERANASRLTAELIAIRSRVMKERPYIDITLRATRKGKPWHMQINRLPWGSSPSGAQSFQ